MEQQMVDRNELDAYLAETLNIARFRDYCPNGLQVEGRARIGSLVSGVTASLALIEAAIDAGADAILVHHGYFWRGEDARIVGVKHGRISRLLAQRAQSVRLPPAAGHACRTWQ